MPIFLALVAEEGGSCGIEGDNRVVHASHSTAEHVKDEIIAKNIIVLSVFG